ncbi:MAG: YggT family protein [Gammaproteobacteria bacterium]|nr:YggT family protein [Gammaproteobacteria bacterium]
MGGSYVNEAGVFLIEVLFGLYILAVMLRFLFQMVRADFYNPFSQAIVQITNPPLRALRRWIPSIGRIDTASLVLMTVVQFASTWLVVLLSNGRGALLGIFIIALAKLLQTAVYVFMFAILILVILSWVAPGAYNPAVDLLRSLSRPLLAPARRVIPPIGNLDLSAMVVLVLLQLALILLVAPIRDIGIRLL